jgi:pyruvate kinase
MTNGRWWALAALALSMLTIGLDATVLNVALPTLATELDASTSQLQWFGASYTLVLGALIIPLVAVGLLALAVYLPETRSERPQAIEHLDEILDAADTVLIARGALGLEMPLQRVPRVQKDVTRRARARRIPVILATQVLESMTVESRPTRAEVSDAANAVDDGVDAIMLAGETASGAFPARAVQTLDAIIRDAESSRALTAQAVPPDPPDYDHAEALCEAAVTLADRGEAHAIIAMTREGKTARRLSALRPDVPILALTDRAEMARRLALYWGVFPIVSTMVHRVDSVGTLIGRQLVERHFVPEGAMVVLVSISLDLGRMDANFLKIQRL